MVNFYGVVWSYSTCIRVTANSGTIIDHIYVNKEENVSRVSVSKIRISDHHVIFCNKKINSCFKIKLQAMQDAPPLQLYPASDKFLM